jgi:hypothetical protein
MTIPSRTLARTRFIAVAAAVAAAFTAAAAQVPLENESHHRVVFQNSELRVLDVAVSPGEATLDHRHDYDIVTVSMTAGTRTRTQAPGQPWGDVRPPRPLGDATVAEYAGKPASHRVENVGDAPYQLFAVENRRASGWPSGLAPLSALATTVTADARAFRIYDVRLGGPAPQSSHTHAVPTIAVLVSGIVLSEGSDSQAKANAPAPVGLKRLDQPGQWVLVPRGDSHSLVRLGTQDARLVEIEVR